MPSSSLTPNTAMQRPTVPELHDLDDTGLDSPVSYNSGTVDCYIAVFGVKLDDGPWKEFQFFQKTLFF